MNEQEISNAIDGLEQLKPLLQAQLLKINYQNLGVDDAREIGEHFNTAIKCMQQQLNNGWILCSERLPEERKYIDGTPKEYSVMIKGAIYPTMLCIDNDDRWFDYIGKYYNIKDLMDYKFEVVAWEYPPEPYKEEL